MQFANSVAEALGQNGYTLICGVNGAENLSPSITYQWIKNNGTQTQVYNGYDPIHISFSPLRPYDAGQYTCQATVSSPYLKSDISVTDSLNVTFQSESNH